MLTFHESWTNPSQVEYAISLIRLKFDSVYPPDRLPVNKSRVGVAVASGVAGINLQITIGIVIAGLRIPDPFPEEASFDSVRSPNFGHRIAKTGQPLIRVQTLPKRHPLQNRQAEKPKQLRYCSNRSRQKKESALTPLLKMPV